jgi:uncharacterized protein
MLRILRVSDPAVATVLAVALVAYNNLLNLWAPFHRFYVPINLCVAAGLAALALGPLGLEPQGLGLAGNRLSELAGGAAAGLVLTAPLYLALISTRWEKLIADRRLADSSRGDLFYRVLLRVPLGTVVLEELAFRGVLFGILSPYGVAEAAIVSSVAFGLWHVVPTLITARLNRVVDARAAWSAAAAGVLVSFVIGLLFVWLRLQTGGLAAPFGMHAAVNSSATLAGFLALRHSTGVADTGS